MTEQTKITIQTSKEETAEQRREREREERGMEEKNRGVGDRKRVPHTGGEKTNGTPKTANR